MNPPTEDELRDLVAAHWSDSRIGAHYGMNQRSINRLRKSLGIERISKHFSNGTFASFEYEVRALIDKDAHKRLALCRFEDDPRAVRAQAGIGPLPARVSFGHGGGSFGWL